MPWLRLDDVYDSHPKLLALTEVERWRWTRVLLHCARHRTNGRVTEAALSELGLLRSITKLVGVELLAERGDEWVVHDWRLYNGGDLDERVRLFFDDHPEANANEAAEAVPGRRAEVLAAIRRVTDNGRRR